MADGSKLAHVVFFTLNDKSPDKQQSLVEACRKYLKPQPGVLFFAAGTRAEGLVREVNDCKFDVALMIVFESRAAHDRYQEDATHDAFIVAQRENWEQVRVFDSEVA
jgi:hypothetical protein